jgi:hypothetical protein
MPLDKMPFIAVKAYLAFFNSILYKWCYTTNSEKVWEMVVLMHLSMLSQRGVGHMWDIWFFDQIFNQMLHCLAINIGQIPYHFAINCKYKYYINKSHFASNGPNLGPNANP